MVTVKEFLNIKSIYGMKLVGGQSGIHEKILNINIMDNPDTLNWLEKGELLLTTGYVFKDDIDFQTRIISKLKDIGCVGIAIKVKRYFHEIPEHMVLEANKYGVPLIEIPYDYSLSWVSTVFYKKIYNKQKATLQQSLNIHKLLTNVALEGGGLDKIANIVVKMIENPLTIVDYDGRLLSYAELEANQSPLNKHLNLEKGKKIFLDTFIERLPKDLIKYKEAIKREYMIGERTVVCRVKPIASSGTIFGYLIVWEIIKKIKEIDYITIEHAATIAALDQLKEKEIKEAKQSMKRDFFDDLLESKIESVQIIKSLCEIHGLDPMRKYGCMVVKIINDIEESNLDIYTKRAFLMKIRKQICKIGEKISMQNNRESVSIIRKNTVIFFIPINNYKNSKLSKEFLKEFAEELDLEIKEALSELQFYIGIGKVYPTLLELEKSFNEAQEAIDNVKKISKMKNIAHFDDFMVYHLLDSAVKKEELKRFYENTIASLVEYDMKNNTNLIESLEMFYKCNGNISEAAKETFVHRNTFIYRMDKIKGILNSELKDPEELLEIQLGLRSMKLLRIHSR